MAFDIATIAVPLNRKDDVLADLGLREGDIDPACGTAISGGAWHRSYILWLNDVADPFGMVPPRHHPVVLALEPGRKSAVIATESWQARVSGPGETLSVSGDAPLALFAVRDEVREQAAEIGLDDEYEILTRFFGRMTGFYHDEPMPVAFRALLRAQRRRMIWPCPV